MVRDHNECIFHVAARLVKRTSAEETTSIACATAMIRRHGGPGLRPHTLLPRVEFAIPGAFFECGEHPLISGHILRIRQFKQRLLRAISVPALVEPLEADVAPTSLGERKVEVEIGVRLQVWQIPKNHLLL